jgi:hypothetical protein
MGSVTRKTLLQPLELSPTRLVWRRIIPSTSDPALTKDFRPGHLPRLERYAEPSPEELSLVYDEQVSAHPMAKDYISTGTLT